MNTKKVLLTVITVLLILTGITVAVLWFNTRTTETTSSYSQKNNTADPETIELQNLGGIELTPLNPTTNRAGNILFTKESLIVDIGVETPIILFGQNLPKKSADEPQRINPNLEIHGLEKQIDIVAAIDGVIGFIKKQEDSNDVEVFLQPVENSDWTIGYDHLVDVTVKQGDFVKAGDVLGKAAPFERFGYYYEIQINEDNTPNGTIMHCPTELLAPNVRESVKQSLDQFVTDWTQWYGKSVFPEQAGGCTKKTLTADLGL